MQHTEIEYKTLKKDLKLKQKYISDLYVLIDTLQTNLESCVSLLDEDKKKQIINVPSYKWCLNWKQGDEKNDE